jgi:hypothetical protein
MTNRPLTKKAWMAFLEKACNEFDWGNAEWQDLTEVEIVGLTCECVDDGTFNMDCALDFARAIEARLKEKNNE